MIRAALSGLFSGVLRYKPFADSLKGVTPVKVNGTNGAFVSGLLPFQSPILIPQVSVIDPVDGEHIIHELGNVLNNCQQIFNGADEEMPKGSPFKKFMGEMRDLILEVKDLKDKFNKRKNPQDFSYFWKIHGRRNSLEEMRDKLRANKKGLMGLENPFLSAEMIDLLVFSLEVGINLFRLNPGDIVPTKAAQILHKLLYYGPQYSKIEKEFLTPEGFELEKDLVLARHLNLRQVFENILKNALFHGEAKKITVKIEEAGDNLLISITDDGKGIEAENLAKIFDDGFTTKKGSGGNGFGLAVSKELVESFGGRIEVESTLGEGTTFKIYLKCAPK